MLDVHEKLAIALHRRGEPTAAIAHWEAILQRHPTHVSSWLSAAHALGDCGRWDKAQWCLHRAESLASDDKDVTRNLGVLYSELGDDDLALMYFNRALARDPNCPAAKTGKACALLAKGEFRSGWPLYQSRWKHRTLRHSSLPLTHELRDDQLIFGEQGIGTEIMFATCLNEAQLDVAATWYECDPRLTDLMRRSFPGVHVLPANTANNLHPNFTSEIGIGSLPHYNRYEPKQFQRRAKYLHADRRLRNHWQQRLSAIGPGLKVGFSWRGGVGNQSWRRSPPIEAWKPLLQSPGIHGINLQYGDVSRELQQLENDCQITLHQWPDLDVTNDLDQLAALIENLALVVCVANSNAHLTGALGVPGLVLVPTAADWRWRHPSGRMMWHPTLNLIRQQSPHTWGDTCLELTDTFRNWLRFSNRAVG
jgi:Tfp pilus assembly protein PilF